MITLPLVKDMWIMCFGILSVGFYADNGKEFFNVKMDEINARLAVTIKYDPAYSLWPNRIND